MDIWVGMGLLSNPHELAFYRSLDGGLKCQVPRTFFLGLFGWTDIPEKTHENYFN